MSIRLKIRKRKIKDIFIISIRKRKGAKMNKENKLRDTEICIKSDKGQESRIYKEL